MNERQDTPHRRAADHPGVRDLINTEARILELIEETDNSRDKAFLLILLKLNNNLTQNTQAWVEYSAKLEGHLSAYDKRAKEEAKAFNQGVGARRVWTWVLGVAQITLFTLIGFFQMEVRDIHEALERQAAYTNELKLKVAGIEAAEGLEHSAHQARAPSSGVRRAP